MQISEEGYKIRMVMSPSFEGESRFIIMDKLKPFDKNNMSYTLGCCLYNTKLGLDGKIIRNGEIPFSQLYLRYQRESSRNAINGPLAGSSEDIFEKPTLEEYNKFIQLLKKNGFSYNRKKGELKKDGRVF
jgi:hypothetical protein